MDPNKTPVSRIQKRFGRKSNRSYYTPTGKENWDPDFVDYPDERRNKNDESPESYTLSPTGPEERLYNESTSTIERNGKHRVGSKHDSRMSNMKTRSKALEGAVKLSSSNSFFSVWEEEECICRD
jgi:hypothetical protein